MLGRGGAFYKGRPREGVCLAPETLQAPDSALGLGAPPSSAVQTAGGPGKAPSQCAKTGWLWLTWFPLALPHSLQLSDFNQWPFPPHVQPSIFRRPWMSVSQHGACSSYKIAFAAAFPPQPLISMPLIFLLKKKENTLENMFHFLQRRPKPQRLRRMGVC